MSKRERENELEANPKKYIETDDRYRNKMFQIILDTPFHYGIKVKKCLFFDSVSERIGKGFKDEFKLDKLDLISLEIDPNVMEKLYSTLIKENAYTYIQNNDFSIKFNIIYLDFTDTLLVINNTLNVKNLLKMCDIDNGTVLVMTVCKYDNKEHNYKEEVGILKRKMIVSCDSMFNIKDTFKFSKSSSEYRGNSNCPVETFFWIIKKK